MSLVTLDTVFKIQYGNQFDLNKLEPDIDSEINFVSRSSQNLGVVCKVHPFKDTEPFSEGLITVTLGGTYLLSSFVQQDKFYTAQNIKVLTPLKEMAFEEKIFYCKIIESNRFRYSSHGREANKTLNKILVPDKMPANLSKLSFGAILKESEGPVNENKISLNTNNWKYFDLISLFDIAASSDPLITSLTLEGNTPYISSTEKNNGIYEYVDELATNAGNTITANRGGSVGFFFYQPKAYIATPVDVRILTPKFSLNKYLGLFFTAILKQG
jgi:Type I restriction modification DNA specificity domain